jgi:predicted secreted protein
MQINLCVLRTLLCISLVTLSNMGWSQTSSPMTAEPRNVVQLSANGTVEAQQDWLTLTLSATRQGSDANSVQAALRDASEAALTALKKTTQAGAMDVRSGAFNLQQRYGNDGKIAGWIGTAELILEGSDFPRISAAAARAQTMTISSLNFGLSRAARAQLETQAQALAIDGFKTRAAQIARGFGFADYLLREVSVQSGDQSGGPMPRIMAMSARAMVADAAPMPMESGKSLVIVTVSGSVQLK